MYHAWIKVCSLAHQWALVAPRRIAVWAFTEVQRCSIGSPLRWNVLNHMGTAIAIWVLGQSFHKLDAVLAFFDNDMVPESRHIYVLMNDDCVVFLTSIFKMHATMMELTKLSSAKAARNVLRDLAQWPLRIALSTVSFPQRHSKLLQSCLKILYLMRYQRILFPSKKKTAKRDGE